MEVLQRTKRFYYIALVLKKIAMTMPHAFLTFIFLEKGITFVEIAIIQSMYSLAMVAFEFPSGLISDLYSKKTVYLVSNILLIITFIIVISSDSFFIMCIAWFIYGISSAAETGTLDAELIVMIKRLSNHKLLEKFLGVSNQLASISALIGSIIGFLLYNLIGISVYYIMIILMIMTTVFAFVFLKSGDIQETSERITLSKLIASSFIELKENKNLRSVILALGFIQMYIQLHFQLWQSFFISKGIEKSYFLGIYLIFQVISILVFKIPIGKINSKHLLAIAISVLVLSIQILFVENRVILFALYSIIVALVFILYFKSNVLFNKEIKEERISSLTSLMSTIMRLFGMVTLWIAGFMLKFLPMSVLFLVLTVIPIFLAVSILMKLTKTHVLNS